MRKTPNLELTAKPAWRIPRGKVRGQEGQLREQGVALEGRWGKKKKVKNKMEKARSLQEQRFAGAYFRGGEGV